MSEETTKPRGKFVVFEGIDGSGKSSAIAAAQSYLENRGVPSILTRQPGGTSLGEDLRTLIKERDMSPISEALLFAACFEESLRTLISPSLDNGTWVLCDRFFLSTLAYQSGGRGLPLDTVKSILDSITPRQPDITILFDVPASIAAERMQARGSLDRFEKEGVGFQEKIRTFFKGAIILQGKLPRRHELSSPGLFPTSST